jgi:hypothetical protein
MGLGLILSGPLSRHTGLIWATRNPDRGLTLSFPYRLSDQEDLHVTECPQDNNSRSQGTYCPRPCTRRAIFDLISCEFKGLLSGISYAKPHKCSD